MDSRDPIRLMNAAARIARAAGDLAATGRRSGVGNTSTKSSPTDLVTQWDTLSEELIREQISAIRPGDGIVGEEGEIVSSRTGITWFVDPIDGTTNFAYGLSGYAVSIAAVDAAGPLAAAVQAPDSREMFVAARGLGSWNRGRRLVCSEQTHLSLALVATGFSYDRDIRREQMDVIARSAGDIRDIRRLGAASLDLCSVASARVDAYFERNLQTWDLAAGTLIAVEAGALVSDFSGRPLPWGEIAQAGRALGPFDVVAGSPQIHHALLELLQ